MEFPPHFLIANCSVGVKERIEPSEAAWVVDMLYCDPANSACRPEVLPFVLLPTENWGDIYHLGISMRMDINSCQRADNFDGSYQEWGDTALAEMNRWLLAG